MLQANRALSPLHLPGHAPATPTGPPVEDTGGGDGLDGEEKESGVAPGLCLCPSWAHGPLCRALPSPLPGQSAVPPQPPVNKRTLPTWSRNKTAMKGGRPTPQTPEPAKSAWPKSMTGPSGESIGTDLFGGGGGPMNVVRLHGSYPRLIGADSDVILWDLRKAQQTLADFQHKLATREIDLLASEKRMRAWTLNRCRHMQRHRALKLQAKLFQNWASNTSRGKLSRKLHTDLAEAHERGINLEQQLAQEKERHEKVATAMARLIHEGTARITKLEQEKVDLENAAAQAITGRIQAEEAANAKVLRIKEDLEKEAVRGKRLEDELNECQHAAQALQKSMKAAERRHRQEVAETKALVNELDDSEALGNRLLRQHVLDPGCHLSSAKKVTALQAYLMHQEEGIEAVRRANEKFHAADPNKVAIFGSEQSFWGGLEAYNGRPLPSSDEQLLEQMRLEFQQCADPGIRHINISGNCSTDLAIEWEFAACPVPGKLYPGALRHPLSTGLTESRYRNPITLRELMQSDMSQRACLSRPEALASRLFTGPCHGVLNGALRQGRYLKGKKECPRFAYFDMPVLMEDLLQATGSSDWRASCGPEWLGIWKSVAEEMNWSSMFSVQMMEAMQSILLPPTGAIFVNSSNKRILLIDVTLEGDFWEVWPGMEGVFRKKHDSAGELKMKQERKHQADLERKRQREEEKRKKREENEEQKRQVYAALKGEPAADDHSNLVGAAQESSEVVIDGVQHVESTPEGLDTAVAGDGIATASGASSGLGIGTDGDKAGGASAGVSPPGTAAYSKVQARSDHLLEKLKTLLGDEWMIAVCPVIAESFGVWQSVTDSHTDGALHAAWGIRAPLIPAEWCCKDGHMDACECVGCVHKLCDALQIPSKKLALAKAVLNASIEGGCGRRDYGACRDTSQCIVCRQGELWKCPHQQKSCHNCAPGTDAFSCTISVLNSAIVKLCTVSQLPPGGLVFRGIRGLSFPPSLLSDQLPPAEDDTQKIISHVYRDFVELGFASVTWQKEEALGHAGTLQCESCRGGACEFWVNDDAVCSVHHSIVLEIETSSHSRCADLSWASQWSSSDDKVLLPTAHFELKGMRRENNVNFIRIVFNSNPKAQKLEEVRANRYKRFVEMAQELEEEGRYLLEGSEVVDKHTVVAMCSKIRSDALQTETSSSLSVPMRLSAAIAVMLSGWTEMMLEAASKHVAHAEALLLNFRVFKNKVISGDWEVDGKPQVGENSHDGAAQQAKSCSNTPTEPLTANLDPVMSELYASIEASRKHQHAAEAKADLLDEENAGAEPRPVDARSEGQRGLDRQLRSQMEARKLEIHRILTQAYRIFQQVGFHSSMSATSATDTASAHTVREDVLRLFELRVFVSVLCQDSQEVTAELYEDHADVLRHGGRSDLELALQCYRKASGIYGEKQPQRAREILFKQTRVRVMLQDAGGEANAYSDLLQDYMSCLGLIAKEEEALHSESENGIIASGRANTDQKRVRALMLKADIHEEVGVLFSAHFPARLSAAPLSLLEALRSQMKLKGVPSVSTLKHIRAILQQLHEDGDATTEQAEQYRLLPCSVYQILVEAEDDNLLQLSLLMKSLQNLRSDGLPSVQEWGLSGLMTILQTEGIEFQWSEIVHLIDIVLKAIVNHAAHEGVAREACRVLSAVLQRRNAWSLFHSHAPNRFGQTHQRIVQAGIKLLDLWRDHVGIHSDVLAIMHGIVADEIRWPYLLAEGLQEIRALCCSVMGSLDVLGKDPLAVTQALQILDMASVSMTSLTKDANPVGILARLESLLAQVIAHHDGSSQVAELARTCLQNNFGQFEDLKAQRLVLRHQYRADFPQPTNQASGDDTRPFQLAKVKGSLASCEESLRKELFALSRKALLEATDAAVSGGFYEDYEDSTWWLSHQVAVAEALDTAKSRLAQGDAKGAQAACTGAYCHASPELVDKLKAIEADAREITFRRQSEETCARHVAAANAALQAAHTALKELGAESDVAVAFDLWLRRMNAVNEESVDVAQQHEEATEDQLPETEKNVQSDEVDTPDQSGGQDLEGDAIKTDSHVGGHDIPEADAEQGLPSLFERIAEVRVCAREAANEFEKGNSQTSWPDLNDVENRMEQLLSSACDVLVKHVHRMLLIGNVESARSTIEKAAEEFGRAGLEDRVDDLLLLELALHFEGIHGLIREAGQMLSANEAAPTYSNIKPAHERLVTAALFVEKYLPGDDLGADCSAGDGISLRDTLKALHMRCADMLISCPRPLAVETRDQYQMALRQFELSGDKNLDETRGAAMKLFFEELLSWESGGHEVLEGIAR